MEEAGEDTADVCRALFTAYAQINELEKAKEAAECAGLELE